MNPFADFDFALLDDLNFKEDAVRESLIKPLLNALCYSASDPHNRILRSKNLTILSSRIVSNRSHKIKSVPDYLLEVNGRYAWVLDAKAPNESITDGDHCYMCHLENYINRPLHNIP